MKSAEKSASDAKSASTAATAFVTNSLYVKDISEKTSEKERESTPSPKGPFDLPEAM